jgi:hypothetical protein
MARADMSRKAVTVRILRTGQLRRLCLRPASATLPPATQAPEGWGRSAAQGQPGNLGPLEPRGARSHAVSFACAGALHRAVGWRERRPSWPDGVGLRDAAWIFGEPALLDRAIQVRSEVPVDDLPGGGIDPGRRSPRDGSGPVPAGLRRVVLGVGGEAVGPFRIARWLRPGRSMLLRAQFGETLGEVGDDVVALDGRSREIQRIRHSSCVFARHPRMGVMSSPRGGLPGRGEGQVRLRAGSGAGVRRYPVPAGRALRRARGYE